MLDSKKMKINQKRGWGLWNQNTENIKYNLPMGVKQYNCIQMISFELFQGFNSP